MARTEDLAKRLEKANADFIAAVEGCGDDSWAKTTNEEGWTVAAVAHHVASRQEMLAGLVQAVAGKQQIPPLKMDDLHAGNAADAKEFASANRVEVLDLAKTSGEKAAAALRQLDDAALNNSAEVLGMSMTADQLAENILIGHVENHLASMRASG